MQVSIETISNLGRRLTVVVPAENVNGTYESRIKRLIQTIRIDGYRPGKVPRKVIESRYGDSLYRESVEEAVQTSLNDAFKQEDIQPAGHRYAVQSLKADKGQPIECSVTFEVYPEVKVGGLNEISIEKLVANIEEADVDRVLEQMRKQHAKWEEVQTPAQKGDRLIVDLEWSDDQNQLHEQKNVPVLLEKGSVPPELEALEGAKSNEERSLKLPIQNPKGKAEVDAKVKIKSVMSPKLPEVNDDFATLLEVQGGVQQLRTEVREHMQRQLNETLQTRLSSQLIDQLLVKNAIEIPSVLVDIEFQALQQEYLERIKDKKSKVVPEFMIPQLRENAEKRVRLSLIYGAIVKEHSIKVDEARVRTKAEEIAGIFETPSAMLEKIFTDKNLLNSLRSQVLEQQVLEKLLEQVQYTDKKISYSELIDMGHTAQGLEGAYAHEPHVHDEHCNHDHDFEHEHND